MGCIRVDKIIDYLCQPLRNCLKDEDPYVRKTAAVCVAKLHDINAQLVEDQGFLDQLRDLLSDSNPMVCPLVYIVILFSYIFLPDAVFFLNLVALPQEQKNCKIDYFKCLIGFNSEPAKQKIIKIKKPILTKKGIKTCIPRN